MPECHCGKDGHPLNSVNCPVHGYYVVAKRLSGIAALMVAQTTSLRKQSDEKDTEFVKRIVSTYLRIADHIEFV
mgnify:CR=1 FL=1